MVLHARDQAGRVVSVERGEHGFQLFSAVKGHGLYFSPKMNNQSLFF